HRESGPPDRRADGGEHGRPADPGGLALPLLRGQPCAALRPRPGVRDAAHRAGRHGRALRARRREARDARRARRRASGLRPECLDRRRRARPGADPARGVGAAGMTLRLTRRQYADLYRPTTGDRVRLADTEPFIPLERDRTTPGEEAKFGGGKVIRDGMGQAARATRASGALDLVITNAVIVDHWGIVKADIGVRDGRIVAIGKAGNPDLMTGVTDGMVVGASTEVIAGEGKIVTAGGLDAHIHFICPQLIDEAISAGLTTLLGGGTGPATGTNATTCAPGAWNIHRMLEAAEAFPLNLGFLAKGNASAPEPLREQIAA